MRTVTRNKIASKRALQNESYGNKPHTRARTHKHTFTFRSDSLIRKEEKVGQLCHVHVGPSSSIRT